MARLKNGPAPRNLAAEAASIPGLRVHGLMGIGPTPPPGGAHPAGGGAGDIRRDRAEEAAIRSSFQLLARLFQQLPPECREVLSMGMTGDFELAIAEGSTMVRVGTGIFGPRRSSG